MNRRITCTLCGLLFLLVFTFLTASGSPGLEDETKPRLDPMLQIQILETGKAEVSLITYFEPPPIDKIERALADALGSSLLSPKLKKHSYDKDDYEGDEEYDEETGESTSGSSESRANRNSDGGQTASGTPPMEPLSMWTFNAISDDSFPPQGRLVRSTIRLEPLLDLLRPSGAEFLNVTLWHVGRPGDRCSSGNQLFGDEFDGEGLGIHGYKIPIDGTGLTAINVRLGYDAWDMATPASVAFGFLLGPIIVCLFFRRAALKSEGESRYRAWLRLWRAAVWSSSLVWVGWSLIFSFKSTSEILRSLSFGLGSRNQFFASVVIYLVPPTVAMIAADSIMLSVYLRMRGILASRKDLLRRMLLEIGASLPIMLIYAGIGLMFYNVRLAIMLGVGAVVMLTVIAMLKKRYMNLAPYALESGPLRDRAFDLATRCGVKLQQVYVLPPDLMNTINAMASSNDRIYLTDALIQNLSKKEVDAVIAHELGHLKHRHAGLVGMIFVVGIVLINIFSSSLGMFLRLDFAFPIGVALFIVITRYLSRRFEYTADTHSAYLMGDPRPLISGLVKMSRLSMMPMTGSSGFQMVLTHPHTANRVDALGRLGNVAKEEWPQLLNAEPAEDRYDLKSIRAEEDRIFSTGERAKLSSRGGWVLILERVVLSAAAALIVQAVGLQGLTALAVYLIGAGITLAVYFWLSNVVPVWGCRALKERLEQKLEGEGFDCESIGHGCFVGFSPGAELRVYEGNTDWDIGYLFLSGGKLVYLGEQTRFALSRNQVQEITSLSEGAHWFRSDRICMIWRDETNDESGAFSFHSADARSLTDAGRKTRTFADRIREWKESPEPIVDTPPPVLRELRPPRIGEVTSHALGDSVTAVNLVGSMLTIVTIAVAVAAALQLSFLPKTGGGALYVIGMSLVVTLIGMVPLMPHLRTKKPEDSPRQLLASLEVAGVANTEIKASREV